MKRRLLGGVAAAVALAGLLAWLSPKPDSLIDCSIFWWAIECWLI